MPKYSKNCRSLHMQTIQLRRSRPSATAVALALAITMLIVYILSLQALPKEEAKAAAAQRSSAEIRMEGMEAQFLLSGLHDSLTQANVAAAQCAQSGGAGLVLREGERYAVVYAAGRDFSDAEAPVLQRSARALTLKMDAPVRDIAAIRDAAAVLRALAEETAALPEALEKGESDVRTIAALLEVYRTQLQSAQAALSGGNTVAALFSAALGGNLPRVEAALADIEPGKIRLIHAAACAEWISLVNNLINLKPT